MRDSLIKNNWIKSIIINVIIAIAILLSTHMVYETNDDYVISSRIVVGYSAVYFVNYYLCLLMTKIQSLTTEINIFVISQMVTSFVSWVCITKLLLDKTKRTVPFVTLVSVIAVLSFESYSKIQFTKTAALACIAGILMCIDAHTNKRQIGYYLAGIVLVFAGTAFRGDVLIVSIAFGGLYIFKLLMDGKDDIKGSSTTRKLSALVLLLVIIGGSFLLKNASAKVFETNAELKQYKEYNTLRSEIVDTPLLDGYEDRLDEYEATGISENDLDIIRSWLFDYDGAASKDNLETIVGLGSCKTKEQTAIGAAKDFVKGTKSDVTNLSTTGIHIIIMIVLALWILALSPKSSRLIVIAIGLVTMVLHIYLYYTGRPANRTLYVPNICAIVLMLYIAAEEKNKEKINTVLAIIAFIIVICLFVPSRINSNNIYERAEARIMSDEFMEYIQTNKDKFYVVATREKRSNPRTLTPWRTPDVEGEGNIMGAGSWGTMSPYLFDKMGKYGIHNPIKDLINNDSAYYVGNKNIDKMDEYYNKWYGNDQKRIYMENIDNVDGIKIWRVKSADAG